MAPTVPSARTRVTGGPRVSVLIPVHNAESTLEIAVTSMLRQTWSSLEIVVVDDGSTDATAEILARIGRRDGRLRYFRQSQRGITPALNVGLRECAGEYIARMDADDISLPWRLRQQVEFMDARPDVAASGTAILPFKRGLPWLGAPVRMPADDASVRTRLLFNPPIMHPTAIVRRSVIDREEFYAESMPHAQDYELWSRLGRDHRLSNISKICVLYRRSAGSISSSRRGDQQARARTLRLANLAALCGDEFVRHHEFFHAEMMARCFAPLELVTSMPRYVDTLVAMPGIARKVVADVWFGYCLQYIWRGGDGGKLYVLSRLASSTGRGAVLQSLKFGRGRRSA